MRPIPILAAVSLVAACARPPASPQPRAEAQSASPVDASAGVTPIAAADDPEAKSPSKSDAQLALEAMSAEIQKDVEELRGAKFLRPVQVKVSGTQELRDYIEQREAAHGAPWRRHRDECVAKLLGLVAPDADLRAIEMAVVEGQVGGFYDPSTDTFFLMDAMKGAVAKVILAHELTHALDDQLYDLDAKLEAANEETDAELAVRSVIEGSGTNLMNRWTVAHGKSIPPEEMKQIATMGADALRAAPPLVWKPLVGSYFAGDAFLTRSSGMNLTLKPAKPQDVEHAFGHMPRSTEQILHPERYWDDAKRDEPVRVRFDVGTPPAGWTEVAQDVLGELALALVTTPVADRKGLDLSNPLSVLGLNFTNKAATGWGGDRLILLERGDDRFVQLVTVWDTAKDAEEFEAALLAVAPKLHVAARDAEHGFVARYTPTHFRVERGTDAKERAFVVVRAASMSGAGDDAFTKLDLPWLATSAAK